MVVRMPRIRDGGALQALHYNLLAAQSDGYGVHSGVTGECEVSLDTGYLNDPLTDTDDTDPNGTGGTTLSVADGSLSFGDPDRSYTLDSAAVRLRGGDASPRWDMVYAELDGSDTPQVHVSQGTPEPPQRDNQYVRAGVTVDDDFGYEQVERPAPWDTYDYQLDTWRPVVPLALYWVSTYGERVSTEHYFDVRVPV